LNEVYGNEKSEIGCLLHSVNNFLCVIFSLSLQQKECRFRQEELMGNRSGKFELRAGYNRNFWERDGDEILDL
jgi:hypothetical protein